MQVVARQRGNKEQVRDRGRGKTGGGTEARKKRKKLRAGREKKEEN